jgi:hypothetical protein
MMILRALFAAGGFIFVLIADFLIAFQLLIHTASEIIKMNHKNESIYMTETQLVGGRGVQ